MKLFKTEKDHFWVALIFTQEIKNTFNILPNYVSEGRLVRVVSDEVHSGNRYYKRESRENARASGEAARGRPPPAVASPLACLSRVYFSRYPPNVELARRLIVIQTDPRLLLFFIPVPPILDNRASTAPNIYLYDVNLHSLPSEYNQLQSSSGS